MKQVLLKNGVPDIENVPSPSIEPGYIIIQSAYSCVSIGTESKGMGLNSVSLWKRAIHDPKKALNFIKKNSHLDFSKTRNIIEDKVSSLQAIGYSSSGVVIEVGKDISDINVGDRVACAGSAGAYHAEQIKVSRNLVVKIPKNVPFKEASTVSLGAIALQGLRRLNPSIGESVAVIGLGVIGQITVQLLKASGCKVIAIDLDSERLNLASQNGANEAINPDHLDEISRVKLLTNGHGVDAVIVAASSSSDEVISSAFNMCRKKAKVILVGDVGLNLKRNEFYEKELDFLISSSYGPGRYDNNYEEKNIDYPYPYVRWTENRNMGEFLNLISCKSVNIKSLISSIYKIDNAKNAYKEIKNGFSKSLLVLFSYNQLSKVDKVIHNNKVKKFSKDKINIAIIGVGSFCRTIHLPNLNSMKTIFNISGVMNRSGHNALSVMKQYDINFSTTSTYQILQDTNIDSVLISSRHDSHFNLTIEALKAGKNVLVEKPLTLNANDLSILEKFYKQNERKEMPLLMVAYNRRFSPYSKLIKDIVSNSKNPCLINYEMNAGYVDKDNWIYSSEGGGRNIGEACHIYDLFNYLIGGNYLSVNVKRIKSENTYYNPFDNFQVSINYENGSIANLTYTSMGSSKYQKETMKIFVDGQTIIMNDYYELIIYGKDKKVYKNKQNKGHKEELISFADGIKFNHWPISLNDLIQSSKISFDVENLLHKN